jgi:hypothetical protein
MKRLVIDVYDEIHSQVKLIAFSQGLTMKQLLDRMLKDFLEGQVFQLHTSEEENKGKRCL